MSKCPYCGDDPATSVLERYAFTLEIAWPNPQNSGSGGGRLHNSGGARWAYKALREKFEKAIVRAAPRGALPGRYGQETWRRTRVTLTRLWGPRKRIWDDDNLVTGGKLIRDALVLTGALVDDSARYARIHYQQRKRTEGGSCAVHVLIEVLDVPVG